MYVIKYKCKPVRQDKDWLTAPNEEVWVIRGDWGPTSLLCEMHKEPPICSMVFNSEQQAHDFMKTFDGHPWYAKVRSYEVLPVIKKYKQVLDGFEVITK